MPIPQPATMTKGKTIGSSYAGVRYQTDFRNGSCCRKSPWHSGLSLPAVG